MNVKLGKTRKEVIVSYLEALASRLPGGTDETHENAAQ
jgi:hypothetical protein